MNKLSLDLMEKGVRDRNLFSTKPEEIRVKADSISKGDAVGVYTDEDGAYVSRIGGKNDGVKLIPYEDINLGVDASNSFSAVLQFEDLSIGFYQAGNNILALKLQEQESNVISSDPITVNYFTGTIRCFSAGKIDDNTFCIIYANETSSELQYSIWSKDFLHLYSDGASAIVSGINNLEDIFSVEISLSENFIRIGFCTDASSSSYRNTVAMLLNKSSYIIEDYISISGYTGIAVIFHDDFNVLFLMRNSNNIYFSNYTILGNNSYHTSSSKTITDYITGDYRFNSKSVARIDNIIVTASGNLPQIIDLEKQKVFYQNNLPYATSTFAVGDNFFISNLTGTYIINKDEIYTNISDDIKIENYLDQKFFQLNGKTYGNYTANNSLYLREFIEDIQTTDSLSFEPIEQDDEIYKYRSTITSNSVDTQYAFRSICKIQDNLYVALKIPRNSSSGGIAHFYVLEKGEDGFVEKSSKEINALGVYTTYYNQRRDIYSEKINDNECLFSYMSDYSSPHIVFVKISVDPATFEISLVYHNTPNISLYSSQTNFTHKIKKAASNKYFYFDHYSTSSTYDSIQLYLCTFDPSNPSTPTNISSVHYNDNEISNSYSYYGEADVAPIGSDKFIMVAYGQSYPRAILGSGILTDSINFIGDPLKLDSPLFDGQYPHEGIAVATYDENSVILFCKGRFVKITNTNDVLSAELVLDLTANTYVGSNIYRPQIKKLDTDKFLFSGFENSIYSVFSGILDLTNTKPFVSNLYYNNESCETNNYGSEIDTYVTGNNEYLLLKNNIDYSTTLLEKNSTADEIKAHTVPLFYISSSSSMYNKFKKDSRGNLCAVVSKEIYPNTDKLYVMKYNETNNLISKSDIININDLVSDTEKAQRIDVKFVADDRILVCRKYQNNIHISLFSVDSSLGLTLLDELTTTKLVGQVYQGIFLAWDNSLNKFYIIGNSSDSVYYTNGTVAGDQISIGNYEHEYITTFPSYLRELDGAGYQISDNEIIIGSQYYAGGLCLRVYFYKYTMDSSGVCTLSDLYNMSLQNSSSSYLQGLSITNIDTDHLAIYMGGYRSTSRYKKLHILKKNDLSYVTDITFASNSTANYANDAGLFSNEDGNFAVVTTNVSGLLTILTYKFNSPNNLELLNENFLISPYQSSRYVASNSIEFKDSNVFGVIFNRAPLAHAGLYKFQQKTISGGRKSIGIEPDNSIKTFNNVSAKYDSTQLLNGGFGTAEHTGSNPNTVKITFISNDGVKKELEYKSQEAFNYIDVWPSYDDPDVFIVRRHQGSWSHWITEVNTRDEMSYIEHRETFDSTNGYITDGSMFQIDGVFYLIQGNSSRSNIYYSSFKVKEGITYYAKGTLVYSSNGMSSSFVNNGNAFYSGTIIGERWIYSLGNSYELKVNTITKTIDAYQNKTNLPPSIVFKSSKYSEDFKYSFSLNENEVSINKYSYVDNTLDGTFITKTFKKLSITTSPEIIYWYQNQNDYSIVGCIAHCTLTKGNSALIRLEFNINYDLENPTLELLKEYIIYEAPVIANYKASGYFYDNSDIIIITFIDHLKVERFITIKSSTPKDFYGIAQNDSNGNETVKVASYGKLSSVHSSLAPFAKYYLNPSNCLPSLEESSITIGASLDTKTLFLETPEYIKSFIDGNLK